MTISASAWRRIELVAGASAAVVSMGVVGYLARDLWFVADDFDFLTTREIGSVDDLLRPHGPHWKTWIVVTFRGLYGAAGVDYWPWYFIPRLVGHAAMAFIVWRVVLRRGADPVLAAGAFAVLLVSSVSFYHGPETVGMYVVFPALAGIALLVNDQAAPEVRHRLAVFGLLVAALMSNGWALAVLVATGVVVTATGRLRQWWAPIVGAGGLYASWYGVYRDELPSRSAITPSALIDGIEPAFVVLRRTAENTLGLPSAPAAIAVLGVAAAVAALALAGRLDRFDAIVVVTLGGVLGLLVLQRLLPEGEVTTRPRFGYGIFILAILAVIPHIRLPAGVAWRVSAGAVGGALVVFNLVSLAGRLDEREQVTRDARSAVETMGALIAAGEPALDSAVLPPIGAAGFYELFGITAGGARRLVDDGWRPAPADEATVSLVRGALRMKSRPFLVQPEGTPPSTVATITDGCAELTISDDLILTVSGPGAITLSGPEDSMVQVTWDDEFGSGIALIRAAPLGLAGPDHMATVTAHLDDGGPVLVCGLIEN